MTALHHCVEDYFLGKGLATFAREQGWSVEEWDRAELPGTRLLNFADEKRILLIAVKTAGQDLLDELKGLPLRMLPTLLLLRRKITGQTAEELMRRRGVKGLLPVTTGPAELQEAVAILTGGGEVVSEAVLCERNPLSRQQTQVAVMMAYGLKGKEIAEQLGLNPSTVSSVLITAKKKLVGPGREKPAALIPRLMDLGLLPN